MLFRFQVLSSSPSVFWALARRSVLPVGIFCLSSIMLVCPGEWAEAVSKIRYYDIYLTGDRVCKRCRWETETPGQVALINRQGQKAIVDARDIIGVDTHPFARKLVIRGLHGTGLAGKVIVPFAFEDGDDFVCKYCD